MSKGTVLIAGGGTGGHIFPGISLFREFQKNDYKAIILTGRKDEIYFPEVLKNNGELFLYNAPSLSKNIFRMPEFAYKFITSVLKAAVLLKKQKVMTIIGMGGYVSAPVIFAAMIMKKPYFLCEQNTKPGKVTVEFAKKAVRIFTSFYITQKYIKGVPKAVIIDTGNPVRENIFSGLKKQEARKKYNLSHCKNVILVIGGSQGAVRINELIIDILKQFPDELRETGIIWITGNLSFEKYKNFLNESGGNGSVFITPFIESIGTAYKACDIAISRSGAGAVMEFAALGLPSILVPYPYATDNHQETNAQVFSNSGAAVAVSNDETPETLGNIIIDLLNNPVRLSRMSDAAKSLSKRNAAADIVSIVSENINPGKIN